MESRLIAHARVVRLRAAVTLRRSLIALCGLLLAVGLAACGHQSPHQNFADANNDGDYISAGYITYQLQISRELNQYGAEDSAYLKGLPPGISPRRSGPTSCGTACSCGPRTRAGTRPPPATTSWSSTPRATSTGRSSSTRNVNPFAWTSTTLQNLGT